MLLGTLERTDGCGIKKKNKIKNPSPWKRHQLYGPGVGKKLLRVLPSFLLTCPVQEIWGIWLLQRDNLCDSQTCWLSSVWESRSLMCMQVSPEVNGHFITSTKGRGSGKPPFRTGFLCLSLAPLWFPSVRVTGLIHQSLTFNKQHIHSAKPRSGAW